MRTLLLLLLIVAPAFADDAAELEKLRAENAKLKAQLAGEAKSINLGRTSFAVVDCSTVNGNRSTANEYYGIRNAFDDGRNIVNNINYTYWLGGGIGDFATITFDQPVTLTSIDLEKAPPFTAVVTFEKGGQQNIPKTTGRVAFEQPLAGVKSVRLTFDAEANNLTVHEIRVMGYPPEGVAYEVARPRLAATKKTAEAVANDAFETWRVQLLNRITPVSEDTGEAWIFIYKLEELPLFRVTVDKATLTPRSEPLVNPQRDAKAQPSLGGP